MNQGLNDNDYPIHGLNVSMLIIWSLDTIFCQLPANRSAEGLNNPDAVYETRLFAFLRSIRTGHTQIQPQEEGLLDQFLPPWRMPINQMNNCYGQWFKANRIKAYQADIVPNNPYSRFLTTIRDQVRAANPPMDDNRLALNSFFYKHILSLNIRHAM